VGLYENLSEVQHVHMYKIVVLYFLRGYKCKMHVTECICNNLYHSKMLVYAQMVISRVESERTTRLCFKALNSVNVVTVK